jgi:hypothetical protein
MVIGTWTAIVQPKRAEKYQKRNAQNAQEVDKCGTAMVNRERQRHERCDMIESI